MTYTLHHGLVRGMRRRGGFGGLPEFAAPSTRTGEISFWMNQDLTNLVIYDVGLFMIADLVLCATSYQDDQL